MRRNYEREPHDEMGHKKKVFGALIFEPTDAYRNGVFASFLFSLLGGVLSLFFIYTYIDMSLDNNYDFENVEGFLFHCEKEMDQSWLC